VAPQMTEVPINDTLASSKIRAYFESCIACVLNLMPSCVHK